VIGDVVPGLGTAGHLATDPNTGLTRMPSENGRGGALVSAAPGAVIAAGSVVRHGR
jgi:hypothetical protein